LVFVIKKRVNIWVANKERGGMKELCYIICIVICIAREQADRVAQAMSDRVAETEQATRYTDR
jgi:hypothetical protein